MKIDPKTMYAQTSDIKARTFLEYRRDMKKKAIAELETLDWLQSKLTSMNRGKDVKVEKSGGDSFLWFLRQGGVSQEADFLSTIDGKETNYEFQLADSSTLEFYDFKISKVAPKKKGKRAPVEKTKFLYLHKPFKKFAFIKPEWIMKNGRIGPVPAWGSRPAYRVPKKKLESLLKPDSTLGPLIERIDLKIALLEFQHDFYSQSRKRVSVLLQKSIDGKKTFKLKPGDSDSLFTACLILDGMNEYPEQGPNWLHEAIGLTRKGKSFQRLAGLVYCVDFLYTKRDPSDVETRLKESELTEIADFIRSVIETIRESASRRGTYPDSTGDDESNSTKCALFILNLGEDIAQDLIHYYKVSTLEPVKRIFENVEHLKATHRFVSPYLKRLSQPVLEEP